MTESDDDGVAGRMKQARLQTAVGLRETVSQERMADLVGAELKRVLHPTQWRRYETGEREPPLDVIRATARVSGLTEAYIAFGESTPVSRIVDARDVSRPAPAAGASIPMHPGEAPAPPPSREEKGKRQKGA